MTTEDSGSGRYDDAIREAAASTQPEVSLAVMHRLYVVTGDHLAHLELTFMPRLAKWKAEAVAQERARIRAEVEGLDESKTTADYGLRPVVGSVSRREVLAIVDPE